MILNRELKYNGYLKIEELTEKSPSGKGIKREVVQKANAVAALVYNTANDKYVFVRQWRPGPEGEILEIPAGVLDKPTETREQCMAREIEEEVGYRVDRLQFIAEGYVSPGATSEMISIYYAEVSQKPGKGGGLEAESEEIEILELSRHDMLSTNFKDLKSIIAVQWARYNRSR
jgi:ADP-ribose pyrophosphatase